MDKMEEVRDSAAVLHPPRSPREGVGDRLSSLPRASPVATAVVPSPGWARATEPHRRARARECATRRGWPVVVEEGVEDVASWHGEVSSHDERGGLVPGCFYVPSWPVR